MQDSTEKKLAIQNFQNEQKWNLHMQDSKERIAVAIRNTKELAKCAIKI
jgi:hypothetical protein